MDASKWQFIVPSNVGMPPSPTQQGDAWSYQFPMTPGKVGYLLCPHMASISSLKSITGRFTLTGDGTIIDAAAPYGEIPTARFILIRDYSTGGRWWSKANLSLNLIRNAGEVSVTASFKPEFWTGVSGEEAADFPTDFASCLKTPAYLGITHGATDAGHGLALSSGSLSMWVKGLSIW